MKKILIIVLGLALGAAIYGVIYFLDPLPPYTTQLRTWIQGLAAPLASTIGPFVEQVKPILQNPAMLAAVGTVGITLVGAYVKNKVAQMQVQAAQKVEDEKQRVMEMVNKASQLETTNAALSQEVSRLQSLNAESQGLQSLIQSKDSQIAQLQSDLNALQRVLAEKNIIVQTKVP